MYEIVNKDNLQVFIKEDNTIIINTAKLFLEIKEKEKKVYPLDDPRGSEHYTPR